MTIQKLKNITYELHKMEKSLVFQVLYQDESWIASGWLDYRTSKGIIIQSHYEHTAHLALQYFDSFTLRKVFLNSLSSTNKQISKVFVLELLSNEKRDEFYNEIVEALKEWDNYVEQLKQEDRINKPKDK